MKIYKKRNILVCSNMAGSEKYPLHFVSKRTHLLLFSNTKSLPSTYHHIEAASVIWKVALNLWSLSLSLSTDIWHQWRGQYCICWSLPYTPKIEEICKMSELRFFFCKLTVACRPGSYLGCKENFPRSLFWDCCKHCSQMKFSTDCPCMMLDSAFNCMELTYMRNHCWLFCDTWVQCTCSSKWTILWWWWWWHWRWQQQCGW